MPFGGPTVREKGGSRPCSGPQRTRLRKFRAAFPCHRQRRPVPITGFDHIQEEDIPRMVKWALAEANPVYPVPVVYNKKRCEKVIRRIIAEA